VLGEGQVDLVEEEAPEEEGGGKVQVDLLGFEGSFILNGGKVEEGESDIIPSRFGAVPDFDMFQRPS